MTTMTTNAAPAAAVAPARAELTPEFALQRDKLTEAVIYLCEKSADDPNFGIIKLVQLLYYADCAAYLKRGAPITGLTYLHFPHGPYPEMWHRLRREMEAAGAVATLYEYGDDGYQRYRLLPGRTVQSETLSAADCAILDEQRERFADFNTAGIAEHSRQGGGWRSTEDGEPIPYYTAGMMAPPLSANAIRIGRELANDIARRC